MGVGVIDWNPGVFGQRHHGEGHTGEQQAGVNHQLAVRQGFDYCRERSGPRDHRGTKQHHQQRRLSQKTHQHFPARAQRAKCRANVHRRQRDKHPCQRKQPYQRNGVGSG